MKTIYKAIITFLFAIVVVTGCKKSFLDRPSLSQISADNFYKTTADLRLATAGLYGGSPWWQWNTNSVLLGDVMSGNIITQWWGDAVQLNTFSITGQNAIMTSGWTGLFNVVAQSNATINAIKTKAPSSIPVNDKNAAIAEARFIRAVAYYNLAMYWGPVPIIEDNTKLIDSPLVRRNILTDVYRFVASDLTYAAINLPGTDAPGRVTKWSAQGMLGKVYLTMAGVDQSAGTRNQAYLDSAKKYAGNVCKTSGLSLLSNYANVFKSQYNDNPESLFALQWAPGVGYGFGNMFLTWSPSSEITPFNQQSWLYVQPTYDLYQLYTLADSVRRKANFMLPGDHYPELNAAGGGYTAGAATMKKHIIGTQADNNSPTMTMTSSIEHNAQLRLADVYLVYAEAILGNNANTTDADALLYFNKVRQRAGVAAAPMLTIDTLMRERRVELAYEGHFWCDLVRLSYYNPQKAVNDLNAQQRVTFNYSSGIATPNGPIGSITPATPATFTLQVPSAELTANPKLAEPPVPYY
jgi:starch-binding outer membrane protein, SusD/RagB family